MRITSLTFILFVCILIAVYYAVPKTKQWLVLLIASIGFYITFGIQYIGYMLITNTSVYAATRFIQNLSDEQNAYLKENKQNLSKEDKKIYKEKIKRKKQCFLLYF